MTILVTVLLVTSVWVFLAAVLGGCGGKDRSARRDADNVLAGEFWLWERRDGTVRLRARASGGGRGEAARPAGPALPSPPLTRRLEPLVPSRWADAPEVHT